MYAATQATNNEERQGSLIVNEMPSSAMIMRATAARSRDEMRESRPPKQVARGSEEGRGSESPARGPRAAAWVIGLEGGVTRGGCSGEARAPTPGAKHARPTGGPSASRSQHAWNDR